MKILTRKILSIVLALLILTAVVPVAFAVDSVNQENNSVTDATVSDCDHICHSENWLIKNILWPIFELVGSMFGMDLACDCSTAPMLTTESLVTDIVEEDPGPPAMPEPGMF